MGWLKDKFKSTVGDVAGAFTGGLVGNDVYGLDITGKQAAKDAEAAMNAANEKAKTAEERMFDKNLALQQEQWDYQKSINQPWMDAGKRGLSEYERLLQDPSSITKQPGYQFRLDQGLEGVTNSSAAAGTLLSGNTLKGLTEYGQNFATNEYQNVLNRYTNLANYGVGGTAAAMGGSQGYAANLGNLYTQQGQNLSNFYMNQGQIKANAANQRHANTMGMINTGLSVASLFTPAAPSGAADAASGGGGMGGMDFLAPQNSAGSMNLSLYGD